MTEVFDESYASAYDLMYHDKDYGGECEAVQALIAKHGDRKVSRLLDLGCGTGRHAVRFAAAGLAVTGIDLSEAMLARARQRADAAGVPISFVHSDIKSFTDSAPFDAVTMNFNVLGYMNSNDDLRGALAAVRRNLRPGGVFVADFWYGPAVVTDPPGNRLREIPLPEGRLLRFSSGELEADLQRLRIAIRVLQTAGSRIVSETEELHYMRYFFPLELELALGAAGLQLRALTGFPNVDAPANPREWMAALAAVAVERDGNPKS